MEDFTIRQGNLSDAEEIRRLAKELLVFDHIYDQTLDIDWMEDRGFEFLKKHFDSKSNIVFVAEANKKIVGYVIGGIILPESYRTVRVLVELEEIFVLDEYRSLNIGTKLMNEFIGWAKLQSAERICVLVSTYNKRGIEYYKRNGFADYNLLLERKL